MCQSKTTSSLFRLPCTKEEAEKVLRSAIRAEVSSRGGIPDLNGETAVVVSKVAENLTMQSQKFGLMFSGQCGNGKSTMARAVAQTIKYFALIEKLESQNFRMFIISSKDLLAIDDTEQRKQVKRLRFLGIEDLGNEPAERNDYGNISNPLVDILEYRYDNQLFTVITTNLTPRQITEKYGVRIADRFREMLDIVVFKGGSFRK